MSDPVLKAPFPWFGGKSDVADAVWQRLGNVPNYIEPFFGSGAMPDTGVEPWGVDLIDANNAGKANVLGPKDAQGGVNAEIERARKEAVMENDKTVGVESMAWALDTEDIDNRFIYRKIRNR